MPRINIGEGTFGELVGSRLTANSVTADKVLIGKGSEMIPDPYFDAQGSAWGPTAGAATFSYTFNSRLREAPVRGESSSDYWWNFDLLPLLVRGQ